MKLAWLREKADFETLRQQAKARARFAARMNLLPVKELTAALDELDTDDLFEVVSSKHLFVHKVRRLAEDILNWRADDRGTDSRFTRFIYWPDSVGVPGGVDPCILHTADPHDPEDWLRLEFVHAMSDRRSVNLRAFRHDGRYLGHYRGLHNLVSSIDRELHLQDNTARFP